MQGVQSMFLLFIPNNWSVRTLVCWTNILILSIFGIRFKTHLTMTMNKFESYNERKWNAHSHSALVVHTSYIYYYYLLFGLVNLICNLYVYNGIGLTRTNVLRFRFQKIHLEFGVQPQWKLPFIIYHFVLFYL